MEILSGNRQGYAVAVCRGRMSSMVPGLLDGHHTGRIHSCFRTGLNLQFGDHLIYLDGGEHGLCCFGMAIAAGEMTQILMCCRTGDLAVIHGGSLRLYGAGGVVLLQISEFACVNLAIPRLMHTGQEKTAGSYGDCYSVLQERAECYSLGLEKDACFQFYAAVLSGVEVSGSHRTGSSSDGLRRAVHFFAGRGKGLTPAGDDILTGYGAVLQCFGKAEALNWVLKNDGLQTTDVSRAYLYAMEQGFANELFVRLLERFWGGIPKLFLENLEQMERIGHTSGYDTLYGMYLGLKKMKEDTQL